MSSSRPTVARSYSVSDLVKTQKFETFDDNTKTKIVINLAVQIFKKQITTNCTNCFGNFFFNSEVDFWDVAATPVTKQKERNFMVRRLIDWLNDSEIYNELLVPCPNISSMLKFGCGFELIWTLKVTLKLIKFLFVRNGERDKLMWLDGGFKSRVWEEREEMLIRIDKYECWLRHCQLVIPVMWFKNVVMGSENKNQVVTRWNDWFETYVRRKVCGRGTCFLFMTCIFFCSQHENLFDFNISLYTSHTFW